MNNIEETPEDIQVWSGTKSNPNKMHAFHIRTGQPRAYCNGRIVPRSPDMKSQNELTGINPKNAFCDKCCKEVQGMHARLVSSLMPNTEVWMH